MPSHALATDNVRVFDFVVAAPLKGVGGRHYIFGFHRRFDVHWVAITVVTEVVNGVMTHNGKDWPNVDKRYTGGNHHWWHPFCRFGLLCKWILIKIGGFQRMGCILRSHTNRITYSKGWFTRTGLWLMHRNIGTTQCGGLVCHVQ